MLQAVWNVSGQEPCVCVGQEVVNCVTIRDCAVVVDCANIVVVNFTVVVVGEVVVVDIDAAEEIVVVTFVVVPVVVVDVEVVGESHDRLMKLAPHAAEHTTEQFVQSLSTTERKCY